jgi:hypothetical protein
LFISELKVKQMQRDAYLITQITVEQARDPLPCPVLLLPSISTVMWRVGGRLVGWWRWAGGVVYERWCAVWWWCVVVVVRIMNNNKVKLYHTIPHTHPEVADCGVKKAYVK